MCIIIVIIKYLAEKASSALVEAASDIAIKDASLKMLFVSSGTKSMS